MKRRIKWIILLAILVQVALLLTLAVIANADENQAYLDSLLSSDIMVLLVVLILTVPVLLITLMLVLAFARNNKKPIVIDVESIDASGSTMNFSGKSSKTEGDSESEERFCMLGEIERKKEALVRRGYDRGVTLEKLCEDFRNYAASKLRLYYSISDIRRFIAGMAVSKIIILQGMSGTGKTSLAHAFGSFVDTHTRMAN